MPRTGRGQSRPDLPARRWKCRAQTGRSGGWGGVINREPASCFPQTRPCPAGHCLGSFASPGSLVTSALGTQSPQVAGQRRRERVAVSSPLPGAALCLRVWWMHFKHLPSDRASTRQFMARFYFSASAFLFDRLVSVQTPSLSFVVPCF